MFLFTCFVNVILSNADPQLSGAALNAAPNSTLIPIQKKK
jgi:hypothetical protein